MKDAQKYSFNSPCYVGVVIQNVNVVKWFDANNCIATQNFSHEIDQVYFSKKERDVVNGEEKKRTKKIFG
jgi:hypothetical protein